MLQSPDPCKRWAGEFSADKGEHLSLCRESREGPLYEKKLRDQKAQLRAEEAQEKRSAEEARAKKQENEAIRRGRLFPGGLLLLQARWQKGGFGTVGVWKVTIKNVDKREVRDIRYVASYYGESGTLLTTNNGTIYSMIRAGQTRSFEVTDGLIHSQADRASILLTGSD